MKSKVTTLFAILFFISSVVYSQFITHERLLSFEQDQVPDYITAISSEITISPRHYKDGKNSLAWQFHPGGEISIKKDLKFEKKDPTGVDTYYSTFVVWVYNEEPVDDTVRFVFLKDGRECSSFPFGINFRGWRAAWVCYERDMEGTPEEGMNEIRMVAPQNSGRLYIDHLLTAAKTDRRHQTPDVQVPFVNANTNSHWLILLKQSLLRPDIQLEPLISSEQKNDLKTIEERFKNLIYTPSVLTEKEISGIKEAYDKYEIKYTEGKISGKPLFFVRAAEAYERIMPNWNSNLMNLHGMEIRSFFDLMYRVAVAYNNAQSTSQKEELKSMFLNMYHHCQDQGFAYGSGLGNITHYGYSFRNLYTSFYLMKQVLLEAGKLQEAEKTLQWYAMTNEVYVKPAMPGMDIDSFNTVTTGRIASILMMEDSPEKVQYMKSFSRWIDNGCLPTPGLAGSFKTDGATFHHCNNYPAYAVGGLDGATNMIYLLNNTSFAVSEFGHSTIKNVLLTMRFYCNRNHYPLSMSGRHPDGRGQLVPLQFARMALAGTPDKSGKLDHEIASAYLRLVSAEDKSDLPEYVPQSLNKTDKKMVELFNTMNIIPESHPSGNMALGYGCVSVHRRNNWSAVARGHSRYLWAAEHYRGANLYGRYLAHGSLQIMTSKDNETVTPATSGWQQEGFDWGRIPGTTAIHLPAEQLQAIILNVDTCSGFEEMLYSDEAFAGGLSQQGVNGCFGMKLHEHDKYNGSHHARKSYHFLNNKIICLGTDIENTNNEYNTETTVFQLAATDDDAKTYWNNYSASGNYWIDHLNTGYYIPQSEMNKLNFEKNFPQHSRKQNTGEETKGDWVSLTFNHGKAPQSGSYEYAMLPQVSETEMKDFARKPTYKVIRQNRDAHIVKDLKENITSYVVFEKLSQLSGNFVQQVDTACLIMLKEDKKSAVLTVCNPDLALYRGPSDDIFDENGKRIERSIYSRPWKYNESQPIPVTITLKGEWELAETPSCKILSKDKKNTVLQFVCKDGASYDVKMNRK